MNLVKFPEMPYARPDIVKTKEELAELIRELKDAATYEQAKAVFLKEQALEIRVTTQEELAMIRHSDRKSVV